MTSLNWESACRKSRVPRMNSDAIPHKETRSWREWAMDEVGEDVRYSRAACHQFLFLAIFH